MLDPKLKRGLLEVCVLSALVKDESYGYKIIRDLSECVSISESTLYPILRRLESAGELTERSVEHNGRLRKMYSITAAGKQQIADFVDGWAELDAVYRFVKESIKDENE